MAYEVRHRHASRGARKSLPARRTSWLRSAFERRDSKHAAWLLLCALVLVVRKPESLLHPQFWAEDGLIFFKQQFDSGASVILEPYAGYLNLTPRLVALLGSLLPISWLPLIYNLSALTITLYVVHRVIGTSLPFRYAPLLGLSLVLVPHSGEVLLTITNIQWVLAVLLMLVLCEPPPTGKWKRLRLFIEVLLTGLTGPFLVLFIPLVCARLWVYRHEKFDAGFLTLCLLAIGTQSYFLARDHLLSGGSDPGALSANLATILLIRVFGNLFFLPDWVSPKIVPAVSVLAVLTIATVSGRDSTHRFVLGLIWLGILIVVLAGGAKFASNPSVLLPFANGDRYFFVPRILVLWSLLIGLDSGNRRSLVALMLLCMTLVPVVGTFRVPPIADFGWASHARRIEAGERVAVPIPPGWVLRFEGRRSGPRPR